MAKRLKSNRRPKLERPKRKELKSIMKPVLPGESGWDKILPPGQTGRWPHKFGRMPAIWRCWLQKYPEFPGMNENAVSRVMEHAWRIWDERRGFVGRARPDDPVLGPFWDELKARPNLASAYTRLHGRAKRVIRGAEDVLAECLDGVRLVPWCIAHFRLPKQLLWDDDVVYMQASCQGYSSEHMRMFEPEEDWSLVSNARMLAGLRKLVLNRWFRFALAAPFMESWGVDLGMSFTENAARVDYVLRHPYSATEGELDVLENSPNFIAAWETAIDWMTHRQRKPIAPPAPCGLYMPKQNGEPRAAWLGDWFYWRPIGVYYGNGERVRGR